MAIYTIRYENNGRVDEFQILAKDSVDARTKFSRLNPGEMDYGEVKVLAVVCG